MPKLNNIPGEPQVWFDETSGRSYLVYFVPGTEPPIPLAYHITADELQAGFGPGKDIKYDNITTRAAMNKAGTLEWGARSELANDTEDPFEAWVTAVNDQAAVRPWLRDNEVLALLAEAMLEGRAITDAEFQQTEWWRTHNESQRQWMLLFESDPATARQQITEQRVLVDQLFRAAGMSKPPPKLVNQVANLYLTGEWGKNYTEQQIRALSDPLSGAKVDKVLRDWVDDIGGKTTRDQEAEVRDLVLTWLGPQFGGKYSEQWVQKWAGKLRSDTNARDDLEDVLRRQRLALFPEYDNENLTYEDIASPWRGLMESTWGEVADETSSTFVKLVRMNDATAGEQLLRDQGLKLGKGKVVQDFTEQLSSTGLGGRVRQVV